MNTDNKKEFYRLTSLLVGKIIELWVCRFRTRFCLSLYVQWIKVFLEAPSTLEHLGNNWDLSSHKFPCMDPSPTQMMGVKEPMMVFKIHMFNFDNLQS